jgi:hypothetical protein
MRNGRGLRDKPRKPGWIDRLGGYAERKMIAAVERIKARVSPLTVRIWAFGMLFVLAGMFLQAVYSTFHPPASPMTVRSPTVPVRPGYVVRRDSVLEKRLRKYWDSIYRDTAMKQALDSVARVRPGFGDTMQRLWEMAHGMGH